MTRAQLWETRDLAHRTEVTLVDGLGREAVASLSVHDERTGDSCTVCLTAGDVLSLYKALRTVTDDAGIPILEDECEGEPADWYGDDEDDEE